MKKKPHQKQGVLKKVFSDFRKRTYTSSNPGAEVQYEVKKNENGYIVVAHKERGANQTFEFQNKAQLDEFLESI